MPKPAPRPRPKFDHWRREWDMDLRETADALAAIAGHRICSHEKVRTLCLPFDDAERSEPDAELAAAIATLTGGEVEPADFLAPRAEAAAA